MPSSAPGASALFTAVHAVVVVVIVVLVPTLSSHASAAIVYHPRALSPSPPPVSLTPFATRRAAVTPAAAAYGTGAADAAWRDWNCASLGAEDRGASASPETLWTRVRCDVFWPLLAVSDASSTAAEWQTERFWASWNAGTGHRTPPEPAWHRSPASGVPWYGLEAQPDATIGDVSAVWPWLRYHLPALRVLRIRTADDADVPEPDAISFNAQKTLPPLSRATGRLPFPACNGTITVAFYTAQAAEVYERKADRLLTSCRKWSMMCAVLIVDEAVWTGYTATTPFALQRNILTLKPFLLSLLTRRVPTHTSLAYLDVDFEYLRYPTMFCTHSASEEVADPSLLVFNYHVPGDRYRTSQLYKRNARREKLASASGVLWLRAHSRKVQVWLRAWNRVQNWRSNVNAADDVVLDYIWSVCARFEFTTRTLPIQYFCPACVWTYRERNVSVLADQVVVHDEGKRDSAHREQCRPVVPGDWDALKAFTGAEGIDWSMEPEWRYRDVVSQAGQRLLCHTKYYHPNPEYAEALMAKVDCEALLADMGV